LARRSRSEEADWLALLSFGLFLVALGWVWATTPELPGKVLELIRDFRLQNVTSHIVFPVPQHNHPVVYNAIMQLCFINGALQIIVAALRLFIGDNLDRKADSISGIVFSFAVGYLFSLLADARLSWVMFLGGFLISVGLSIVTSSLIRLFGKT